MSSKPQKQEQSNVLVQGTSCQHSKLIFKQKLHCKTIRKHKNELSCLNLTKRVVKKDLGKDDLFLSICSQWTKLSQTEGNINRNTGKEHELV